MFQELNISNVSIFVIDCQSNTFVLMNIIISDISKLAIKTSENLFIVNFEQISPTFWRIEVTVGDLLI